MQEPWHELILSFHDFFRRTPVGWKAFNGGEWKCADHGALAEVRVPRCTGELGRSATGPMNGGLGREGLLVCFHS